MTLQACNPNSQDCPKCGAPMRWKYLKKAVCDKCDAPSPPPAKDCPICGIEMDYHPTQHWTGQRHVVTAHKWQCRYRAKGKAHFVTIEEPTEYCK
jgi:ribosomal protein L40E